MHHKVTIGLMILLAAAASIPAVFPDEGQMLGGSSNSPIKIEVFSDFQCPACRDLYLGTIKQVLQDYSSKDRVSVIYHEYPLSSHQYSREAAKYCEAASRLGRSSLLMVFDSLFADQGLWSQDGNLDAVLIKALPKGDFQKLKQLLQDASINLAIDKEIKLGLKKEVASTPTMFISFAGKEQKVVGAITYPSMKQFLDAIVK
jgi:protein-disulfide isomerase